MAKSRTDYAAEQARQHEQAACQAAEAHLAELRARLQALETKHVSPPSPPDDSLP